MVNEPEQPGERKGLSQKQIIAIVIAVVAVIFIAQNNRSGHFHFLWFDFEAPTWIWFLVIFAAGVVAGLLIARHRAKSRTQA
jgi:uncharacterized integral membrane protein